MTELLKRLRDMREVRKKKNGLDEKPIREVHQDDPSVRKIAILNFKGGTGKTTTAINLSHALALSGQINSRTFDNYFISVRENYGRNYQKN